MNITLSADPELIAKSRRLARQQGTSLNQLVRDYLERFSGSQRDVSAAEEFRGLALDKGGRSAPGFRFDREEAHARR
ncbi:MAG: DUF6364 family protein [Kiritimatiellae bacterium]|nr:DUF6364 family protein [Kiritimatiellia bacterium]MDD3545796.1 DUF6364 family protein [Kiritimatiellia bacterium]MDD4026552.1 DUF6364 family protein [Kiritimatiellia bacterium]MDD4623530.1 DUF6364 family protein [Kiritimatiellia bacterium]